MPDKVPLIQPGECVLLLVDLQAGLAFGVSSEDRQTLVNNAIALARTAVVFGLPVVVSTSASKVYSGPFMPAIAKILPSVQPIERRNMNVWEDEAARAVVAATGDDGCSWLAWSRRPACHLQYSRRSPRATMFS